jgi:hypothetical protein
MEGIHGKMNGEMDGEKDGTRVIRRDIVTDRGTTAKCNKLAPRHKFLAAHTMSIIQS